MRTLISALLAAAVAIAVVVTLIQLEPTSRWLETNKDSLGGLASFATIVGLLGTLAAVVIGVRQLSDQRRQGLAVAMYGAMKDVRELLNGMRMGSESTAQVYQRLATGDPQLAEVVQFYAALFQLRVHGVFGEHQWRDVRQDLSALIARLSVLSGRAVEAGPFSECWSRLRPLYGASSPFAAEIDTAVNSAILMSRTKS